MSKKKVHLLTIDPQNDFCIANEFDWLWNSGETVPDSLKKELKSQERHGTLVVPGADKDMIRLASFIDVNRRRISEITCTLDSHQVIHIAHPSFWLNGKGEHPVPFTLITADDVRNGFWRPFHPDLQKTAQNYVDALKANKRYELCIWPPHCLIGSWGHSIVQSVSDAFNRWESETINRVTFVTKGSNFLTEHYSGVQADVPDDSDPTTKLNTALIDTLLEADEVLITGEALSHCVCNTVQDVAAQFGDDNIKKFTLLEDTTSSVPGFEKLGTEFVKNMVARGMKVIKTTTW